MNYAIVELWYWTFDIGPLILNLWYEPLALKLDNLNIGLIIELKILTYLWPYSVWHTGYYQAWGAHVHSIDAPMLWLLCGGAISHTVPLLYCYARFFIVMASIDWLGANGCILVLYCILLIIDWWMWQCVRYTSFTTHWGHPSDSLTFWGLPSGSHWGSIVLYCIVLGTWLKYWTWT